MKNVESSIQTCHCFLKPVSFSRNELLSFHEILDDCQTRRFLPELHEMIQITGSLQNMLMLLDDTPEHNNSFLRGIYQDGELIGFISLIDLHYKPTLIYAMHPESRNLGFMTECVRTFIRSTIDSGLYYRIFSETYKHNLRSYNILISCGFEQIGYDEEKYYLRIDLQKN